MPARRKSNSSKDRKPRRSQVVPLSADQINALIRIWRDDPAGIRAFAKRMAKKERPMDSDVHTENVLKNLYRIEDKEQGITQWRFETIAEVLKITPQQLKERISAPDPGNAISSLIGPWITDEQVLAQYRRVYYGYYYTKRRGKYFWMHHKIDFSTPYKGCLHTTNDYGIDEPIYYKVYAYVFREMLVVITHSDEEPNQLPSVSIYHDFCRRIREGDGYFSIRVNEDWNGDFGVGASMMFREPFLGTKNEGKQSAAMCEKLTEYWKELGGELCNRLLHLFGYGPFSQTTSAKKPRNRTAEGSRKRTKG